MMTLASPARSLCHFSGAIPRLKSDKRVNLLWRATGKWLATRERPRPPRCEQQTPTMQTCTYRTSGTPTQAHSACLSLNSRFTKLPPSCNNSEVLCIFSTLYLRPICALHRVTMDGGRELPEKLVLVSLHPLRAQSRTLSRRPAVATAINAIFDERAGKSRRMMG